MFVVVGVTICEPFRIDTCTSGVEAVWKTVNMEKMWMLVILIWVFHYFPSVVEETSKKLIKTM
jgi:hypothetical protein